MIILLLLTLSFHLANTAATPCDQYNITHFLENDAITINFPSNNLLKLNRKVRCTSTSSSESITGCAHHCIGLGYGQDGVISVEIDYNNGNIETCSITFTIQLQPPSLAYLNITNNKVRLGITRPADSFDYVKVHCPNNKSYIIFDPTLNNPIETIDCSFLLNTSLMNFALETVKKDFNSAVNHITREIPLPISFTFSNNSRLLTVNADPPPTMNIVSTYEFQLIFHDKNTVYERIKISGFNPKLGSTFNYSLIPNFEHTIIFKHIVDSIGYAQSNMTIPPISDISYPFEVTNLHIKEEFDNILLNWSDTHDVYDPIEFIVFCTSSQNSMRNVGRNTTYICEQMTFNETNIISIQTRVVIPGYTHDRIAVTQINVQQIPEIPIFEVFNTTENSITIRWNLNKKSLIPNLFQYKINCGLSHTFIQIDIQSNEYQCQSLVEGTLYIITMILNNINNTIQRSRSIYANTLLQTCQYKNHFYSPDFNGTRSVIIEWNPPGKNFDTIYVFCPSSNMTFEYPQIMPSMFVKCIVTSGVKFTVTFVTAKSGYEWKTLRFTDTSPIDLTTTTQGASIVSSERPWPITDSDCSQDALTRWRTVAMLAGFLILAIICLTVLSILLSLRNQ